VINPKQFWNFDDIPGSREKFFQLSAQTADEDVREIYKTQIARTFGLEGNLEKALEIISGITSHSDAVNAYKHIELGRIHRTSGNIHKAKPEFENAAMLSNLAGLQELRIDALHMLALLLPPDEQISKTLEAIEIAENSTDQAARNWVASLLNNLGVAYSDKEEWNQALACFEEALKERELIGVQSRVFEARYMIGWALRNLGETANALQLQTQLQKDLLATGHSDKYVEEELQLLKEDSLN